MRDSFAIFGGEGEVTLGLKVGNADSVVMNLTNHEIEAVFSGAGNERSEWREAA